MKNKFALTFLMILSLGLITACGTKPQAKSEISSVSSITSESSTSSSMSEPQIETFTVVFDSKGGTTVESQIIEKGGKIQKPENPTKQATPTQEYEFLGWYLGDEPWDFENDVVSREITLIALWKTKTYSQDLPI